MTKGIFYILFGSFLLCSCDVKTSGTMNRNPIQSFTLKPGPEEGKDVMASSFIPNKNYGHHQECSIFGWTNGGEPTIARQFIEFDLSTVKHNSVVHYAELWLFNSPYTRNAGRNGKHFGLDSIDGGIVERVVEPWEEYKLTWNSMPETDEDLQIFFDSPEGINDNLRIDVTDLVREMVKDPEGSHGFAIRLKNENYYRALILGSSDCPDSTLWPALKLSIQEGI